MLKMNKAKLNIYSASIAVFCSLLNWACFSSKSVNNYDYTYLYDDSQKLIKPSFKLFHHHEDSSILYYQLKSNNILYGRLDDSLLKARIWVKYRLYSDLGRSGILDSTTLKLVNYGHNDNAKILQGKISLKVPTGGIYPMEIRFRDANKDLNVVYQIKVDKRENANDQYFLLLDGDKVLVEPIIDRQSKAILHKSPLIEEDHFTLQGSEHLHPMTTPPFAKSNTSIEEISYNYNKRITFIEDTFHLRHINSVNKISLNDNDSVHPFFYYHFHSEYPKITDVNQLIQPIRYISTSSEYKSVTAAINKKKAIDNFWLKLAKNEERAKKLIKEYYSRIESANTYFSSYKEGWKTDRGIIYIVYGNPTTVYKTLDKEVWIYGEENNILSLKFTFIRAKNPQSGNDFRLIRNSDYKTNWYRAVDLWRQAKVL